MKKNKDSIPKYFVPIVFLARRREDVPLDSGQFRSYVQAIDCYHDLVFSLFLGKQ